VILDEKDAEKIRALTAALTNADRALKAATFARMNAEIAEHRAAEASVAAEKKRGIAVREACLRAGIDPEKPFDIDTEARTIAAKATQEGQQP
jgi:hypothetical protein